MVFKVKGSCDCYTSCKVFMSCGVQRWHRGQQLWLAAASVVPGGLVYQQTLKPVYAALILVFLYFLSKRHAFLVQRQFEQDQHDLKVREADEKQRVASLPIRKRRAIERAKRRGQDDEPVASEAIGSDHKDE